MQKSVFLLSHHNWIYRCSILFIICNCNIWHKYVFVSLPYRLNTSPLTDLYAHYAQVLFFVPKASPFPLCPFQRNRIWGSVKQTENCSALATCLEILMNNSFIWLSPFSLPLTLQWVMPLPVYSSSSRHLHWIVC